MDTKIILDIVIILAIGLVYFLLNKSIPSYFAEKGKNLATKQDIGKITDEIESTKQYYKKEIEELKSKLATEKEITSLALQARNVSLSSYSDRIADAIQKMWNKMRDFREKSGHELTHTDLIKGSKEYENFFEKEIKQITEIKSITPQKIGKETTAALRDLSEQRVWLGEDLWNKFNSYILFISTLRIRFYSYLQGEDDLDFSNDDALKKSLEDFFDKNLMDQFDLYKNIERVNVILASIERQILNHVSEILSGKKASKATIEEAQRIEEIKDNLSKKTDEKFT